MYLVAKKEKKPKTPKVEGFYRSVLSANLQALVDRKIEQTASNPTAVFRDMEHHRVASVSTLQRIIKCECGANLDTIEGIAVYFALAPYQLMLPNLDIDSPQEVSGAANADRLKLAAWRKRPVAA